MIEPDFQHPQLTCGNDHALLALPDGLSLHFKKVGDRWSHQLRYQALADQGLDSLLLDSIEGDASQTWPPSPPLQSLDCSSVNDLPVLFAVGQAGQGHWSASVSLDPLSSTGLSTKNSDPKGLPIRFAFVIEIAWFGHSSNLLNEQNNVPDIIGDRMTNESSSVYQSTYAVSASIDRQFGDTSQSGGLKWCQRDSAFLNELLVVEPFSDAARNTALSADGPRLKLLSAQAQAQASVTSQATRQIRWGYRLFLRSNQR